jgi:hypothetical protein
MSIEHPHFAFPFTLGVLVEQGSVEELEAAAAVIACTPRGHRDDRPAFGVTSPVFEQGPVDTERLADEIAQSDARLALDAEETIDLADATRRLVRLSLGGI